MKILVEWLECETQRSSFLHKVCENEKNSELDPMESLVCLDRDGSGSFDV